MTTHQAQPPDLVVTCSCSRRSSVISVRKGASSLASLSSCSRIDHRLAAMTLSRPPTDERARRPTCERVVPPPTLNPGEPSSQEPTLLRTRTARGSWNTPLTLTMASRRASQMSTAVTSIWMLACPSSLMTTAG